MGKSLQEKFCQFAVTLFEGLVFRQRLFFFPLLQVMPGEFKMRFGGIGIDPDGFLITFG